MAAGDGVVLERRQVDIGQRLEQLRGPRALDGDERRAQRRVVEGGVVAREPLAQRGRDGFAIGRVGHDHEALTGDAVDDQVVDDAAVVGADHRVVRAAFGQARRVADDRRREAAAPRRRR